MDSKGKSSYARKGKQPFRYSDEYRAWVAAGERHGYDSDEVIAADAAFRRRFNVPQATEADFYARH